MKTIHLIAFLFVFGYSFSQTKIYEQSKIIDHIVVEGTSDETFQLYLPHEYDSNEFSAIVFIFDPSGNGTKGIKPFIESAERFNYILVCSNNSKNGPYEQNFDYTNRLFSHVFSKFKIDEKQIYTAGFSGGSRLASTIAVLTGAIQGVIACGAGFLNDMDKKPSSESTFSYVGLVGDEDMNFQEMLKVTYWLDSFKVDNEIFIYEDGHRWPPTVQILRAFKWLELQAYKRKLRQPVVGAIQDYYKEDLVMADSLSQTDVLRSVSEYERLIRNYSSYINMDDIHEKIKATKRSKKYKEENKRQEHIAHEEEKVTIKLMERFYQEATNGESPVDFSWWQKQLKALDKRYLTSDDTLKRKMGKRIQNRIRATAYEWSMLQRLGERLDIAIYCDRFLSHMHPEEPYWNFRLAETYAINEDALNARRHLQLAIDKGFENYGRIHNNPIFQKLKGHKMFDIFIASLPMD